MKLRRLEYEVIAVLYRIIHKTEYIYPESANLCYNEARLSPRSFSHPLFEQKVLSHFITVEPSWTDQRERTDFFGNQVYFFTIRQPHQHAIITATSEVRIEPSRSGGQTSAQKLISGAPGPAWENVRRRLQTDLTPAVLDARQFVLNSPNIVTFIGLTSYAAPSFPAGRPILAAALDFMQRIHRDFRFVPGVTTVTTPLTEVLEKRHGVCQDFAQLMIGCLRAHGLAARYVSGYIETLPPPGEEKLAGADASHAWCSVFVPDLGWIDFDPTNNIIANDQHITLGWGREFSDVTPLNGVFFSNGEHELKVSVDVVRKGPTTSD